ncbi:MAG: LpxI family protein [Deltaproteobacteria bacterium]|nr:LpxI family protein [Deltaproteobacteria bacterium]
MAVSANAKSVGLIAGNGKFPLIFAQEAKRQGYRVVAVAHRGETAEEIATVADAITWIYVGQLGKIIRTFQQAGVRQAVMAGGIRKVKLFGNFRPDLRGVSFLARMKSREDDALLRGIAGELERDGIQVIESTFCLADIMPKVGALTSHEPTTAQRHDIEIGFAAAKEIGRLGIGQTVVVKDRVIVAVEAIEGTDAAILRGGSLAKGGCVVVKVSKPHQDLRFDVPAVGVETIKSMAQAGASVLAVEAEKTILLEKEALLAEAQRAGIVVVAVSS